jgi:hypothetical protein
VAETHVATNLRFDRTGMLKRIAPLAFVVAVALLLLAVVYREPIERALAVAAFENATGLDADVDDAQLSAGQVVLSGVHARSDGNELTLLAPRAVLSRANGRIEIELDGAQAGASVGSWDAPLARARAFAHRFGWAGDPVIVRLHDCALVLDGTAQPGWNVAFGDIDGTLRRDARALTYDLTASLADSGTKYPLAGRAVLAGEGVSARWTAAELPLAPIAAAFPSAPLRVTGGRLTGVDLAFVRSASDATLSFDASAHLVDGAASLSGDRLHALSGLHGTLLAGLDRFATPKIEGVLDGLPFDVAGEIDGLAAKGDKPSSGVRDMRQLAQLTATIADQSNLTLVHVETTAPGVSFGQYGLTTEHGPLAVQVVAIDPHEPSLHFDTALSNDRIISGGERTSAMGLRTGAIAGVNGDYFDIGRTYQPQGLLIEHGELLRGPTDRMALVIHRDGSVRFDEFHIRGTVHTLQGDFPVTQLNNWPPGEVTVITPAFGKELPPAPGVTFAALTPLGPAGAYTVASLHPMDAAIPVQFGLAFGPLAHVEIHPGDEVDVKFALDPPAGDAIAGIGGGPLLLRDGEWYEDPHAPAPDERDVRWPVVALARLADDSLLLVAVDGRHPERSIGMTRPDFADLLRDFKAVDAMALDSGGSVTLIARAPFEDKVRVRNVPSDNSAERWVSDGLFLYSSAPPPSLLHRPPPALPPPSSIER